MKLHEWQAAKLSAPPLQRGKGWSVQPAEVPPEELAKTWILAWDVTLGRFVVVDSRPCHIRLTEIQNLAMWEGT